MKKRASSLSMILMVCLAITMLFSHGFEVRAETIIPSTELTAVVNKSNGVSLTWDKVSEAKGYYILRKVSTNYVKIAKVVGNYKTTYLDKLARTGKSYDYAVQAYNGYNTSEISEPVKVTYLSQPTFTLSNVKNGVEVNWGKVVGAKQYEVYKEVNGVYSKIATVESTNYIDTDVNNGSFLKYTVKAVADGYSSSYKGIYTCVLGQPNLAVTVVDEGLKVSWDKSVGATKYEVYKRLKGSNSFELVYSGNSTSFVDTKVVEGCVYEYYAKAKNMSYFGADSKVYRVCNVPYGEFILENTVNGDTINIYWNKVEDADSYKVYREYVGSHYSECVYEGNGTFYDDCKVDLGVEYFYTIKIIKNGEATVLGTSSIICSEAK